MTKEKKNKSKKGKKSKKEKTEQVKPTKKELAILKSLGKMFTIDRDLNSDPNADVPYVVNFKHKGLQYITGGSPGGLFVEAHGPSQCSKSYLMYELGLEYIKAGGWYYQCDAERAYKKIIGRKIGLEGNFRFAKSKQRGIETVFAEMKSYVLKIRKHDKKCPILTSIDSYNFLRMNETMKELEKEYKEIEGKDKVDPKKVKGYASMRKNAIFGDQLKDYLDFIEKYKVTFLLLSQEKTDYSIMFGSKKTVNAEKIISYDCSLRLRGYVGQKIKHKTLDKIIGRHVSWECIKSRHPDIPPFMITKMEIIYKTGIREFSGLFDLLINDGRIKSCKVKVPKAKKVKGKVVYKSVDGFQHGDNKINKKDFNEYVQEHPELLEVEP